MPTTTRDHSDPSVASERPLVHVTELDLGGDLVIVTDRTGTIVDVNDAFVEVTGYSRHEAIGGSPRMLSSGHQSDDFYRELWQTITRGQVWRGQLVDQRRDGTLRTYHATITPVRDHAGRVTHFVAVERDISEQLHRESARGSTGSVHTDRDGRCVYADDRAAALLGRPATRLLGDGLAAALEPGDADALRELVSMVGDGGRTHRTELRTTAGGWLHVEVAPLTTSSGEVIGATCALDDVDEQLAVHRELARRDALLASIVDAVPDPLAAVDADGTVVAINRAWREATVSAPNDVLLSIQVGHDLLGTLRASAATGDGRSRLLLRDLGRMLHGMPLDPDPAQPVEVTPLAWDEGGAVLRLPADGSA